MPEKREDPPVIGRLPEPTPAQKVCPHKDIKDARARGLNPRFCNDCGLQMYDLGD